MIGFSATAASANSQMAERAVKGGSTGSSRVIAPSAGLTTLPTVKRFITISGTKQMIRFSHRLGATQTSEARAQIARHSTDDALPPLKIRKMPASAAMAGPITNEPTADR